MNTIGENIALLRKQKEMTQETLAAAIGVSSQSVSKWENNTNMPDIMLLPIIADIFEVNIDVLFGRTNHQVQSEFGKAFDLCCDTLLANILSCHPPLYPDEPFKKAFERYKERIVNDNNLRTAIVMKNSAIYYREEIGGLLLKKPKDKWYELLLNASANEIINLLSNSDFCTALTEIIKSKKTAFTISSLCNKCKIDNLDELENHLQKSKLFSFKKIDIDDAEVTIYELVQGQKLFLLFAILIYAKEYNEFKDIYAGYYGDGSYYFE